MTIQQQRQQATNLNNIAGFFIQMERPSEAMRVLRQAASALRDIFAGTSAIKDIFSPGSDSTKSQQRRSPAIRPRKIHHIQTSSSSPRDETLQPLYDRALTVSNSSSQDDELISATILYNMALLYHLRGIDQGKSVNLDKALHLYQTALVILANCDFLSSICHSIKLLQLALHHNSAQIYLHSFQREGLDESISYMRYILNDDPNTTSSSCQEENEEDDYDYSFFSITAMICSGDLLNIAPAA